MASLRPTLGCLLLALTACGANSYSANMIPVGDSLETGIVTVTDDGNGALTVSLTMANVPASTTQPVYLRNGQCGSNGSINQDLEPLVNATAALNVVNMTTAVNADYDTLKNVTYIDVHASYIDLSTIVACADLH